MAKAARRYQLHVHRYQRIIDQQREWYAAISDDPSRLDWIVRVDEEDAGLLSILNINHQQLRCDWGYYIASTNMRGRGVGRNIELNLLQYVFETMEMNKLCCEVFCSNEVVIKIHEKYGSRVRRDAPAAYSEERSVLRYC